MDTVRDHQAPTVSVSLREPEVVDNYHRDQQASASTVLSTHMCVSTTNPSAHKLLVAGGDKKTTTKQPRMALIAQPQKWVTQQRLIARQEARISDKRNKNEILTLDVSCLLI